MSAPTLKLVQGLASFDLNNQVRFFLWQDFVPPAVSVVPILATGTSANRDGAKKVGSQPVSRSFVFHVNMRGGSTAEMRAWAGKIQDMLDRAGDDKLPVYLVYKPDSDTPEPLWGQAGAALRYEVIQGKVNYMADYLKGARIATDLDLEIVLLLKPYASGKEQRAASATGRIHEDMLGVTDGVSRGLVLGRNHTCKITNPVFGHATWDTGWTADASLTATKNIYREYLMPGAMASALLVSRATNQEFYQSINVGNTQTHTFLALVQRPDFGTVTSDDVVLFYSSALSSTFTDLGNGLWAVTATAAGINASTNTGVQVKNGRSIYLLYCGAVDTDDGWFYPFWGDNLGCAWSGTAHASTSTSSAGRVRLPVSGETVNIAQGSIRMVVKLVQNANFVNPVFFSFGASSLRAGLTLSTMTLTLTDNVNTASSSASAVTAGATVILHFVWGSDGLKIYLNGVVAASNGTFTLPSAPTYLYIGTDDTPTAQTENPIHGFAVWAEALTAAQIALDADNLNDLSDDRLRIEAFPWLWTKDGDDVLDNHDDSGEDNWGVVGGVPGSAPADVVAKITPSGGAALWLGVRKINLHDFILPTTQQAYVESTENTVDANSSNGNNNTSAISTSNMGVSGTISNLNYSGPVHAFLRCRPTGTVATRQLFVNYGGGANFLNGPGTASSANVNVYYFGSISVKANPYASNNKLTWYGVLNFTTTATGWINDFGMVILGALTRIIITGSYTYLIIDNRSAITYLSANDYFTNQQFLGNEFSLSPNAANVLSVVLGDEAAAWTISLTATFDYLKITPKYTLL